ncbi:hypothetical protein VL01_03795 [Aeromonas enteropelogenes]|nr:hypothetical protein VL01_03795 [Aeromonas enteropelogenes]
MGYHSQLKQALVILLVETACAWAIYALQEHTTHMITVIEETKWMLSCLHLKAGMALYMTGPQAPIVIGTSSQKNIMII